MFNNYIIEVGSEPAGIVVRDEGGFRFFSATHSFFELEGRVFGCPRDAQSAAERSVAARGERARAKLPHIGARRLE